MKATRKAGRLPANSKRGLSWMAFASYGLALGIMGVVGFLVGDATTFEDPGRFESALARSSMKQPAKMSNDGSSVTKPSDSPMGFSGFLANLKSEVAASGVSAKVFDNALGATQRDPEIIGFTTRQPEHERTPWDYVGSLVSDKRIADGLAMMTLHADTLAAIEATYGVDRHIVIAIWGIESSYGSGQGGRNVLRSLATLAYEDKRRAAFWKKQLIAALQIVANGDITAEKMGGSWAGAMGHTQFMPTTYSDHAVDFDGDGRRDIWTSIPDALASTANYLKASNWQQGANWGSEVVLPSGFDFALSAPGHAKSITDWQQLGISAPSGRNPPAGTEMMNLLLPAGARGPAFLVAGNFKSILRYNNSTLYALSVGLLAQRLAKGPSVAGSWPLDLKPLARPQREELQRLLVGRGFDTGGIDGILGGRSRAAIRTYQTAENLPADGYPSTDLLDRLRLGDPTTQTDAVSPAGPSNSPAVK